MKQSYDTQKGEKQMRMNENHQACMPAEKKTLYRIGIFAATNHVTIRTLRFYEERGCWNQHISIQTADTGITHSIRVHSYRKSHL